MLARMKLKVVSPFALMLLLTLAGCKSGSTVGPAAERSARVIPGVAQGAGFDYYLLNLSWSPEYCHSHPEAAECAQRSTFVLHGLWPQNNDGSYPEHCADAPGPANPGVFSDIYPEPGLLEHEWKQHGSCTGLSAEAFFTAARTAYKSITIPPALANLSSQTSMPPGQIAGLFTESNPSLRQEDIAISCGHNYLTAVEICLDKSLHPMACPAVRSCRANSVRIAPPQ